jgi:16S rRNA (uracil1498-N3)-methyltransferase
LGSIEAGEELGIMRRFFIDPIAEHEPVVILDREESRHLTRVLRLEVDDEVELIDGTGNLYCGRVESLGEKVLVNRLTKQESVVETAAPLWVCQGDLKGKKMDLVVQKCTELGVSCLLPFASDRSQGRIDIKRSKRRQERWDTIIKSACKQSGRLTLMEMFPESSFSKLITARSLPDQAMKILFWEEEQSTRLTGLNWRQPAGPICLMIGPEGGFSATEAEEARDNGWQLASLGRQVLRAETAVIAAVAITQYLRGVM